MLCRPWDKSDFLDRLKTFSRNYFWAFQETLDPFLCSQKGWRCIGHKELSCDVCKANLKLPMKEPKEELLSSGHKESCAWRTKACQDVIYYDHNVDLEGNVEVVKELLLMAMEELKAKQKHLSNVNIVNLEEYLDVSLLKQIMAKFFPQIDDMGIFLLGLFGWRFQKCLSPENDSNTAVLECSQCYRRIGLWKSDKDLLSNDFLMMANKETGTIMTLPSESNAPISSSGSSDESSNTSSPSVFDPSALSAMPSEQVAARNPEMAYPLRSEMYQLDPVAAHRPYCSIVKSIKGLHESTWSYNLKTLVAALIPDQTYSLMQKVKRIKTLS